MNKTHHNRTKCKCSVPVISKDPSFSLAIVIFDTHLVGYHRYMI